VRRDKLKKNFLEKLSSYKFSVNSVSSVVDSFLIFLGIPDARR